MYQKPVNTFLYLSSLPPSYIASQPWPFPSSLMIGFGAEASPSTPATSAAGGADVDECGLKAEERTSYLVPWLSLPPVRADENELEVRR